MTTMTAPKLSNTYAPEGTPAHALVRGITSGYCYSCGHLYRHIGDTVHTLPGTCEACGGTTAPMRTVCDPCRDRFAAAAEAARLERLAGTKAPAPVGVDAFDDDDEPRGRKPARELTDEERAAKAEAQRRQAEAVAYVASYRGTWGLPLDIRANPKWGTKYLKLTGGQVEALLRGKARDEQRAAEQAVAPRHPRYDEAVRFAIEQVNGGALDGRPVGFLDSIVLQLQNGRTLSDRQVEAVLRFATPRTPAGAPAAAVTEGWYDLDGTVYKVQRAVNGSGNLYAKVLVIEGTSGTWQYEPGAMRKLAGATRLTVEAAAAYGKLYGVCMACGRTLTDEVSIEQGIGPVCSKRVRELEA